MGRLYVEGEGVALDRDEALRLFTLAAAQQHSEAAENIVKYFPESSQG